MNGIQSQIQVGDLLQRGMRVGEAVRLHRALDLFPDDIGHILIAPESGCRCRQFSHEDVAVVGLRSSARQSLQYRLVDGPGTHGDNLHAVDGLQLTLRLLQISHSSPDGVDRHGGVDAVEKRGQDGRYDAVVQGGRDVVEDNGNGGPGCDRGLVAILDSDDVSVGRVAVQAVGQRAIDQGTKAVVFDVVFVGADRTAVVGGRGGRGVEIGVATHLREWRRRRSRPHRGRRDRAGERFVVVAAAALALAEEDVRVAGATTALALAKHVLSLSL